MQLFNATKHVSTKTRRTEITTQNDQRSFEQRNRVANVIRISNEKSKIVIYMRKHIQRSWKDLHKEFQDKQRAPKR